jgi:transposase
MLSFSGALRVFVAIDPCDMRKGFNGLHALVTERLAEDPRGGSLFVFTNRRRNRIKILCNRPALPFGWGRNGLDWWL